MISAMAFLAVLAFSNFGTTSAEAGKRHHKPILKTHHVKAPGHRHHRARHNVRHRKFTRHRRYKRHVRSSFKRSQRSRYRVIHTSRRAHHVKRYKRNHRSGATHHRHRDHGHAVHHHHRAGGKYRNRTQFCRRNWERHHGHKVVVRRCVWVHNSKLRRYSGH